MAKMMMILNTLESENSSQDRNYIKSVSVPVCACFTYSNTYIVVLT